MNACMERSKKRMFIKELETVSAPLASWAQDMFDKDWSIEDVKIQIKNAMKLCERD